MSAAENKALMRRYLDETWGVGSSAAVDQYVHPDIHLHDLPPDSELKGSDAIKNSIDSISAAMPGGTFTIDQMVADGDKVAVRYTADGVHREDFFGVPPTHQYSQMVGLTVARLENGKLVEGWQTADILGVLLQLGVMPRKVPLPMKWMIRARGRKRAKQRRAEPAS